MCTITVTVGVLYYHRRQVLVRMTISMLTSRQFCRTIHPRGWTSHLSFPAIHPRALNFHQFSHTVKHTPSAMSLQRITPQCKPTLRMGLSRATHQWNPTLLMRQWSWTNDYLKSGSLKCMKCKICVWHLSEIQKSSFSTFCTLFMQFCLPFIVVSSNVCVDYVLLYMYVYSLFACNYSTQLFIINSHDNHIVFTIHVAACSLWQRLLNCMVLNRWPAGSTCLCVHVNGV